MTRTRKTRSTSDKGTPRDKYLRKNFLIYEDEYLKALRKNGGVCSITGNPPTTKSLAVDHDHKIERWKIVSKKVGNSWASFPQGGCTLAGLGAEQITAPTRLRFTEFDRLKQVSRAKVKARLKRLSVRGILSWRANTGLKKWDDNPGDMRRAAEYIENYQKFLAGESDWRNGFEGE